MISSWKEQFKTALIDTFGAKKNKLLYEKYSNAFHASYYEDVTVEMAVNDIILLEKLSEQHPLELDLYQAPEKTENLLHVRLFQFGSAIPLSDILPILENLDLRTFNERPYEVKCANTISWISDFSVMYVKNAQLDFQRVKSIFQEALVRIYLGQCENDGFNKLVLGAELNWREITILRTYVKYLKQTGFHLSQKYIEETLSNYALIAKDLVDFFKLRFDFRKKKSDDGLVTLEDKLQKSLDAIIHLEEDRIMRYLYLVIKATLRTNYFYLLADENKDYLAIKIKSAEVPELPLPQPLYEIFVCSPRFYAIHLRSAKVARGGIRWSDRQEDMRTEILGLMKAQRVKNAVIIPSGAKGGFVLKTSAAFANKKTLVAEVIKCYELFIRGLLDLTDNIIDGKPVHPKNMICRDDFDPYLVVAADKGTGEFSDIANGIAKEYNFWLGDAFASGGSTGYNHKKMGITARGAWESIRRHFLELDVNIDETDITMVGIGDMSGDVFGNGLIYSDHIKLVAAFDHRDIFIDPNPDPKKSYMERARLFRLTSSSWQNYNRELISTGGGVYSRLNKSILLTPEMKTLFDVELSSLTPDELIRCILKAPVDLLYNGGIGTYVKSTSESQEAVGDRINDFCRVNGHELRCRVVGEGGNLGFTQLGRIEYALHGGLINTDFIDNSGGVDCSDHEVNIKILLDQVVADGKLTEKQRNILLHQMQDEIGELVLNDNYKQALAISLSAVRIIHYSVLYQNYIRELESIGELDRYVEFIPDDKIILERRAAEQGFTRPEIAVLLAYTKIHIKKDILKSDLLEDPYFKRSIEKAFPKALLKSYRNYMFSHRLHREIISTQLSNQIVNEMGVTFIYREQSETGATIPEVIRAYTISSRIFESDKLELTIEGLGSNVSIKLRYELLHHLRHLLNISTRWFLRSSYLQEDISKVITHFSIPIKQLEGIVPELMTGTTKAYLEELAEHFINAGIPKETATRIATYRAIYILLNVIEVATQYKFDIIKTAKMYFHVGNKFNLVWFRDHIASDLREGHWNNLARLTLRDELDILQKLLTVVIMRSNPKEPMVEKIIEYWARNNPRPLERWEKILQMLHGSSSIDYTMFFVALRELSDWIHLCEVGTNSMLEISV